jgi:hypothetical protein
MHVELSYGDIHFGSREQLNSLSENIFQNIKKFRTNFLHVHPDILCSYTNFQKERTFFVSYIKKQIYVWIYDYLWDIFFSFLPMPHKMFFFCLKLVWRHWMSWSTCEIYFSFFLTFWNLFFYVFSILDSYKPGSQNTFSVILVDLPNLLSCAHFTVSANKYTHVLP